MFNSLKSLFSASGKRDRQRQALLRPEYSYLFDTPRENEWISLDCEMTGLNPKTDHILSIGAVKITAETLANDKATFSIDTGNALSLVCRPPVMPSRDSIEIHGLRPADVENGIRYEQMLAELLPFIGNRPIVGFCVDMDMGFLNAVAKPFLGVTLPNSLIDVSQFAHQRQNARNPEHASQPKHLNILLDEFNIPRLPAHDAVNDAVMTAMLFVYLNKI